MEKVSFVAHSALLRPWSAIQCNCQQVDIGFSFLVPSCGTVA